MCWSPEVSLGTYLFSAVPLFLLTFYYKTIPFALFLAMHSWISMQLIEFFLWIYLNNPSLNYFFSIIGFIAIMAQPFFFILSLKEFKYMYIVLLLYLFSVILYYIYNSDRIEFKTVVAKNGHLEWKWLDVPFYNALLWVAFFCFRSTYLLISNFSKNKKELFYLIFMISGFGISYATFVEAKTWGSMWCWIAHAISLRYYWTILNM